MGKLKERICYGLSEAGLGFSFSMVSAYLTIFYTDVVGLTPAIISMIMLVARVWDAVNDPMMGIIANRTTSRWGRYRPYILFGSPILAVTTILTFTCPGLTGIPQIMYSALTYISCGMAYTVVGVASQALLNVMTADNQERVLLLSYRGVISGIASIITEAVVMPMILYFGNGSTSSPTGYTYAAIVFCAIGTVLLWISFAGTKERLTVDAVANKEKISVKESLTLVFGNKDIRKLLCGYLVYMTGVFGRVGLMVYFFLYVVEQPTWIAAASVVLRAGMLTPSLFMPFLTKRFEKKHIMIGLLLFGCVGSIIMFFGGSIANFPIICIGTFIFHGCGGAVGMTSFAIVAELIDDMEVRTGKRADAICTSITSFGVKLGNAVAGSVGIIALAAVGFVANEVQSAATKTGMSIIINIVPGIMFLITAAIFSRISMNKAKAAENTKILEERHSKNEL